MIPSAAPQCVICVLERCCVSGHALWRHDRSQIFGYSVQLVNRSQTGIGPFNIRLPEGAKPENYKEGATPDLETRY